MNPAPFHGLSRRLIATVRVWLRGRGAGRKTAPSMASYVRRIISDAILFNEVPSPTENEEQRASFVAARLGEFGIGEVQVSPEGAVSCELPSSDPNGDYLLLLANTENESYSPLESLVRLTDSEANGLGIADNSLGVATLLVLVEYLQSEQVRLGSNLVLLFTPLSSPAALETFIHGRRESFRAALHLAGLHLGEVETSPLGASELVVSVRTPDRPVYPEGSSSSAVSVLAGIASRLGSIRWSGDDRTVLNIARLRAGVGFGYFASQGILEVEILSPNGALLQMATEAVTATIRRTASEMGSEIEVEVRSTAPAAGAERNRFLVDALLQVHRRLGIKSREVSSMSRRPDFGALDMPVTRVGITTGRKTLTEELVHLAPIEKGFRQVLLLLEELAAPGRDVALDGERQALPESAGEAPRESAP
jgi:tripeptide aminopeptidase